TVHVAAALCHGDLLVVVGQRGTCVVAALEGHARRAAAAGRHLIDLRLAAAVGGEVQGAAVRAPRRFGVDAELPGDLGQRLAGQVHDVDFRVAAARQGQRQPAAVGREVGRTVDAAEAGNHLAAAGGDVLDVDRGI